MSNLNLILLHDQMLDKQGDLVTTSLTLIDLHDIARSCRTYGIQRFFIAHPSTAMRRLARTVKGHWQEGYGATYNPNRKDALELVRVVSDLDEAISEIDTEEGQLPTLLATSARPGPKSLSYSSCKTDHLCQEQPILLMFGTGWGMSPVLLDRAEYLLAPINGPTEYNHLSVRSACAIILDRLLGNH